MIIPGSVTCDFCKLPIDDDLPYPSLSVPMPLALRQRIRETMVQSATLAFVGPDKPPGIEGAIPHIMVPLSSVPSHFKLEVCMGCVEGFFPDVLKILEEQVLISVKRKIEMHQKRAQHGITDSDDD